MTSSNHRMDIDEYLVSMIAKHPGIYDKHTDDYKDHQRKQESWDAIADAMNLDAESVKRRWENLRDRFVRVYREFTASQSPVVKTKFKLFDQMLWLAPHIRKRRMTPSVFVLKNKQPTPQFSLSEDTQSSETHELQEGVNVKTETQSNSSELTFHESCFDEEALLSSTSAHDVPRPNDEILNKSDHYFMMSIVHDCQNMHPRKKLKFKKEVLTLLEKYLYEGDNK